MEAQQSVPKPENAGSNEILATLKLICTKAHMGPFVGNGDSPNERMKRWSAAANKITFENDLKVRIKSSETEERENNTQSSQRKNGEVSSLLEDRSVDPAEAAFYMEAWDLYYGSKTGTTAYIERSVELDKARLEAYEEMGINLNSCKGRPELTQDQREFYNEKVSNKGFSYYELRLSYKHPQKKAVRSKTYRLLTPPNLESTWKHLDKKVDMLKDKFVIEIKKK